MSSSCSYHFYYKKNIFTNYENTLMTKCLLENRNPFFTGLFLKMSLYTENKKLWSQTRIYRRRLLRPISPSLGVWTAIGTQTQHPCITLIVSALDVVVDLQNACEAPKGTHAVECYTSLLPSKVRRYYCMPSKVEISKRCYCK